MNPFDPSPASWLRQTSLALALCLSAGATWAGPGAHGPNGEHLDGHPEIGTAASAAPRMEASSDLFEVVARLGGGELSILIDRFASNEPVLNASVEVESGAIKAQARFHEDLGDYAVDDPAMLKLLSQPGDHALVVTVLSGDDSDLLDGVLKVAPDQAMADNVAHDHAAHWGRWTTVIALLLGLAGLSGAWSWRRRASASLKAPASTGEPS